tara:strand:- start:763 stop:1026 length:264 start_codon:yes stop_codon:yes gene_type:complete
MKIEVEVRDIETIDMGDKGSFQQVTMLECGQSPIKNFLMWNVMSGNAHHLKGIKVGHKGLFQIRGKVSSDYEDNLKIKGEFVESPKS